MVVSLVGRWSFAGCGRMGHVDGQLERASSAQTLPKDESRLRARGGPVVGGWPRKKSRGCLVARSSILPATHSTAGRGFH